MQRSITHQNNLTPFIYVGVFALFSSLSSIYLILPPMLGVLFVLFKKSMDKSDSIYIVLVSICLVIFEVNNGYMLFSSILYFFIVYKAILPKIKQNFSCLSCMKIAYVLIAYLGYYFFLLLVSNIFLLPEPSINYYIVYYIVIEFFLVSLL